MGWRKLLNLLGHTDGVNVLLFPVAYPNKSQPCYGRPISLFGPLAPWDSYVPLPQLFCLDVLPLHSTVVNMVQCSVFECQTLHNNSWTCWNKIHPHQLLKLYLMVIFFLNQPSEFFECLKCLIFSFQTSKPTYNGYGHLLIIRKLFMCWNWWGKRATYICMYQFKHYFSTEICLRMEGISNLHQAAFTHLIWLNQFW